LSAEKKRRSRQLIALAPVQRMAERRGSPIGNRTKIVIHGKNRSITNFETGNFDLQQDVIARKGGIVRGGKKEKVGSPTEPKKTRALI